MKPAKVFIVGDDRPFVGRDVELLENGWVRAVGHWPRFDIDDDTGEVIVVPSTERECSWPPSRIKEVRRDA